MKGLLLKDWYMMNKYCRAYYIIVAAFIAISLANQYNLFFAFYPCVLCGMIPVTLLSYDERNRWMQYSGTMPYTKTQIVSAKYLFGLLAQVVLVLVTGFAHGIKMALDGDFVFGEFAVLMLLLLAIATLSSSIFLPFIFKLGVEKGRIAYYVIIGFICGASILATGLINREVITEIHPSAFMAIFVAVCIGVYALSWYLSVVFFKKRDIY